METIENPLEAERLKESLLQFFHTRIYRNI